MTQLFMAARARLETQVESLDRTYSQGLVLEHARNKLLIRVGYTRNPPKGTFSKKVDPEAKAARMILKARGITKAQIRLFLGLGPGDSAHNKLDEAVGRVLRLLNIYYDIQPKMGDMQNLPLKVLSECRDTLGVISRNPNVSSLVCQECKGMANEFQIGIQAFHQDIVNRQEKVATYIRNLSQSEEGLFILSISQIDEYRDEIYGVQKYSQLDRLLVECKRKKNLAINELKRGDGINLLQAQGRITPERVSHLSSNDCIRITKILKETLPEYANAHNLKVLSDQKQRASQGGGGRAHRAGGGAAAREPTGSEISGPTTEVELEAVFRSNNIRLPKEHGERGHRTTKQECIAQANFLREQVLDIVREYSSLSVDKINPAKQGDINSAKKLTRMIMAGIHQDKIGTIDPNQKPKLDAQVKLFLATAQLIMRNISKLQKGQ